MLITNNDIKNWVGQDPAEPAKHGGSIRFRRPSKSPVESAASTSPVKRLKQARTKKQEQETVEASGRVGEEAEKILIPLPTLEETMLQLG